jgi:hypothetical protein
MSCLDYRARARVQIIRRAGGGGAREVALTLWDFNRASVFDEAAAMIPRPRLRARKKVRITLQRFLHEDTNFVLDTFITRHNNTLALK